MTWLRELELTADRLRHLPAARLAPHEQDFYTLLAGLTDRPVPRLAARAWGDQLLLIGRDAPEAVDAVREFRRSLDMRL